MLAGGANSVRSLLVDNYPQSAPRPAPLKEVWMEKTSLEWIKRWLERLYHDCNYVRPYLPNDDAIYTLDEAIADIQEAMNHLADTIILIEPEE